MASVVLQILLAATLFLQVNYLSCRRNEAWDLSRDQRFTLSSATEQVIGQIGEPITLVVAFLTSSPIYEEVRAMAAEYDRLGKGQIRLETLDLGRSRDRMLELESAYGVKFTGDQLLVLGPENRFKVLRSDDLILSESADGQISQFLGEEKISSSILELIEGRERRIALLAGDRPSGELAAVASRLIPFIEAQNGRLETLNLEDKQSIPADLDCLLLLGNTTDLTERETALLEQSWTQSQFGIVCLLDPAAATPNLDGFLRSVGVGPRRDRVLSVVEIPGMAARKTLEVPVVLLPSEAVNEDLGAMTTRFSGLTRSIDVLFEDDLLLAENIRPIPLAAASEGFWGETEFQEEQLSYNPDRDTGAPDLVFVSGAVERGLPGDANLERGASRLVVIGNAEVISAESPTQQVAADFFVSSMNWVMKRGDGLGLPPRSRVEFSLPLSGSDFGLLQIWVLFIFPAAFLGLAAVVLWRRRRW